MTEIRPQQVENYIVIVQKAKNQSSKKNTLYDTNGVIRIKFTSWKFELLSSYTCIKTNCVKRIPPMQCFYSNGLDLAIVHMWQKYIRVVKIYRPVFHWKA